MAQQTANRTMGIMGALGAVGGVVKGLLGALLGGGESTVSLFRAVSPAEAGDIVRNGFRAEPAGRSIAEGKWFATSAADATKWGNAMFGSQPFHIVEAAVSADALPSMIRVSRMDNIGPAVFATLDQLLGVSGKIIQ